jgi:2-keto-4-pentenoate hydratase/2-oxohepta-3-ene-1,7-dioic acid hydratase in catechol pathway
LPNDVQQLLEMEHKGFSTVSNAAGSAKRLFVDPVRLLVPVVPRKLMTLGINYRKHFAEMRSRVSDFKPPAEQV